MTDEAVATTEQVVASVPKKRGRKARVDHQAVIDAFKAGTKVSELASTHSCSVPNIHAILKRNGVK